jgi:hypothetical protein
MVLGLESEFNDVINASIDVVRVVRQSAVEPDHDQMSLLGRGRN